MNAHGGPVAGAQIIDRSGQPCRLETSRRTLDIDLVGTFNVLSRARPDACRRSSPTRPLGKDLALLAAVPVAIRKHAALNPLAR